jgi:LysM repeat protein/lysophospholipase L1-like esterase
MRNSLFILLLLLCGSRAAAQVADSSFVAIDSVQVDTIEVPVPKNEIQNPKALYPFFKKLAELERLHNRKINIVHIGDSHIQADLMTNKTRKDLQAIFGNGGRGFTFPHRLAGTNGSSDYKFTSNANWDGYRNINTPNGSPVGLSGNALTTRSKDFVVELDTKMAGNEFTTIKLVTPENRNLFDLATAKKTIAFESDVPKKITHKIKNGEALSIIADKYNVSIADIKKANGLKNDRIRAGKTLNIPSHEMQKKRIERSEFIPLPLQSDDISHYYVSDGLLDKIYILPAAGADNIALDGVILENNTPGLLYHNIGVNGAKFSDFNKYPAFFSELKALQPDLVIVSLGTNESFDKMRGEEYLVQLDSFLQKLKAQNPDAVVLVLTPPPSLFKKKFPNTFAADYAQKIVNLSQDGDFAAWDLYSQLGGLYGVSRNAKKGLIGGDRVHYTNAGYEKQGALLTEAILKSYQDFKDAGK